MPSPSLNVNTIVRAGAGAGKTRRLIETVEGFCKEFQDLNSRFPRIIVCTFTRKAAKELRERLMAKALESGDWDFVRFVTSQQLHVSTIHGVLLKFLSHFGYRLGLDPRFRFVDDTKALHQSKNLFREILTGEELKAEERALILQSFDLKSLAELGIRYFEFSGWRPEVKVHEQKTLKILLSQEIADCDRKLGGLINDLEPFLKEKPIVGEISSWLAGKRKILVQLKEEKIGFSDFLDYLSTLPRFQISEKNPKPYDDVLLRVREIQKEIKKDWASPAYDSKCFKTLEETFSAVGKSLSLFRQKYLEHKLTSGELQISDLEVISLELIRNHPDTAKLFSLDWDFWMVDEYQDTSPIQVELIKQLQGSSQSFTVGDPQQSIYLFRGARCEVFAAKEEELKVSHGRLDHLDKNYRSRPQLVNFFNSVFAKETGRFFKAKAANEETKLEFADVRVFLPNEGDDGKVMAVVAEVQRLLNSGVLAENIAILARQKKSLKTAAKELLDNGIPCLMHSAGAFYERREILDALTLLCFLLNPHDNTNFINLIRSPWFKVDDQKIVELLSRRKVFSFWSEVGQNPNFKLLKDLLAKREHLSITELFRQALVDFGFFDFSHYLDLSGRREANLWKLVNDLEQAARQPGFSFLEFSRQKMHALNLDFSEDEDAISARETNRVNLMTVHQSKGLQFDHVIVIDIHRAPKKPGGALGPSFDEEKALMSFPVFWPASASSEKTLGDIYCHRIMKKRELEESARVFYVAVTRAVKSLVLIGNQDPEKNSWQEFLALNSQDGDHRGDGFSYTVLSQIEANERKEIKREQKMELIEPAKIVSAATVIKTSVTQLMKSAKNEGLAGSESRLGFHRSMSEAVEISQRGIRFHKLLESVKYQGLDFGLENAGRAFPLEKEKVKAALKWVYGLKTPNIAEVLASGQVEWGFLLKEGNQIIEGQIDLWGKADGKIWIVDYKTGSSRYSEKAFEQMNWYAKALRTSGIREEISAAVVFPFEQKVEARGT